MRSNEPCTSEEAEDCSVLARKHSDDSADVYGECRDNIISFGAEQTKKISFASLSAWRIAYWIVNQPCTSEEAEDCRVLACRIIAYNPIPALT